MENKNLNQNCGPHLPTLNINTSGFRIPTISVSRVVMYFVVALVLACLIVLGALKKVNFVSVFSIIILTIIFFILLSTMGSSILAASLPFSAYPNPPHLGLDGISPSNYLAGRNNLN